MRPEIEQFVWVDNQKFMIIEVWDLWVRIQNYASYRKMKDDDFMTIHKDSLEKSHITNMWNYKEELDQLAF